MIKIRAIEDIAKENDSFYLYDEFFILDAIEKLKKNFPDVEFLYSLKSNPNKKILDTIFNQGIGADAASFSEVWMSFERGVPIDKILYSAPGKSKKDIEMTIDKSIIIADSFNEILMISEVARELNLSRVNIGVRINPNFTFESNVGGPGKFGIDEEEFFEIADRINGLYGIRIVGIHAHVKSQELNHNLIADYYEKLLDLTIRVQERLGYDLEFLNMGSGIGIPYKKTDEAVNVEELGEKLNSILNDVKARLGDIRLFIETGRYLVGKSGVYVSKIRDIKVSRGKKYLILSNTLNGFYRPSINEMVKVFTDDLDPKPCEPLFTSLDSTQISILKQSDEKEVVTIVGNLCTATDVVAQDVLVPKVQIGDLVVFNNAGAYSYVLTPLQFASLEPPAEYMLTNDDLVIEVD